jgi:hypothetical protein
MPRQRTYQVVMADNSVKEVVAKEFDLEDGDVLFTNEGEYVLAVAHGEWKTVELLQRDEEE